MKLVILSILMVAIAFLLLGIKVLFVKGAQFPMGHHAHAHVKGSSCLQHDLKNQIN